MDHETVRYIMQVPAAVYLIYHLVHHMQRRSSRKHFSSGIRFPCWSAAALSVAGRILSMMGAPAEDLTEDVCRTLLLSILIRSLFSSVLAYALCFLASWIDKGFGGKAKTQGRELCTTAVMLFLLFEFHDLLMWVLVENCG